MDAEQRFAVIFMAVGIVGGSLLVGFVLIWWAGR